MKKKKIMKIKENRKKEKKHERIKGNERKKEAEAKN